VDQQTAVFKVPDKDGKLVESAVRCPTDQQTAEGERVWSGSASVLRMAGGFQAPVARIACRRGLCPERSS
jgi:hypothetical protein